MKKQTLPDRKIIRLAEYDYNVDGVYFITICSKNREKIFSEIKTEKHSDGSNTVNVELTEVRKTAEKYILSSERIAGVKIDDYVIMPNHIHIIVALECSGSKNCGTSGAPSSTAEIYNTTEYNGGTSGTPSPTASHTPANAKLPRVIAAFKRLCNKEIGYNVFQRSYMEHIIRDFDDYIVRKNYITNNPIRWIEDKYYI